jgi:DNA-binding transcriptional regulator YiaG
MNNQAFEELLKLAGLSKKDFATLVEMNYNSVTNWNKSDKIPQWVNSWLTLYIENAKCKELKQLLKETVCDSE